MPIRLSILPQAYGNNGSVELKVESATYDYFRTAVQSNRVLCVPHWAHSRSFICTLRTPALKLLCLVRKASVNLATADCFNNALAGVLNMFARQPFQSLAVSRSKGVDKALVLFLSFLETPHRTDVHSNV